MTWVLSEAAHVETLVKHLPPSASTLRLLDLTGGAGDALRQRRADLAVTSGQASDESSVDAVVGYGLALSAVPLESLLVALRPGGRLILLDPDGDAAAAQVRTLEAAGYTRILVEELPTVTGTGVLLRGEKPHVTADTLARIQSVAGQDAASEFRGRYVHLLIQQTPNKPAWALKPGEAVTWHALALADEDASDGGTPHLLAFSSLPNAVAFMQPAVVAGTIKDVNKVARFARATAQNWRLLVNPPLEALHGCAIVLMPVDPALAETPDE